MFNGIFDMFQHSGLLSRIYTKSSKIFVLGFKLDLYIIPNGDVIHKLFPEDFSLSVENGTN